MSRQERLDASCLVGIVAILLILLGAWFHASVQPASAAPVSMAATVAAPCDDCDPDEGEQLTAAELAELGATMEPCVFDEAAGPACYWDAATRGNKQGDSFIWTGDELVYAAK